MSSQLYLNPKTFRLRHCPTDALTFVEELVASEESLPRSGVVGLEDHFEGLMDRNERPWKLDPAQSVLEVLHKVKVNRKDVDVVEEATVIHKVVT